MSTLSNDIYPSKKHELEYPSIRPSALLSSLHSISSALHSITSHSIPALLQLACLPTKTTILAKREIGDFTEEDFAACIASDIQKLSQDLQNISSTKDTYKLFETVLLTTTAPLLGLLPTLSLTFLAATSSTMFKLLKPATSNVTFNCPRMDERTVVPFRYFQPSTLRNVHFHELPDFPFVTKVSSRDLVPVDKDASSNLVHITHWTFSNSFNLPIPPKFLPFLTHLTFGDNFDRPVDLLPITLTHLIFGQQFNQSVEKLPPFLRVLKFTGNRFDHSVDNLPQTIRELVLSISLTRVIRVLPPFLTRLEVRSCNSKITFPLQELSSLRHLTISGGVDSLDHLPNTLTELYIFVSVRFLPAISNLPTSIKKLEIGGRWTAALDFFPPQLTHLHIHIWDPPTLTHFHFETVIFPEFEIGLPPSLIYLNLEQSLLPSPILSSTRRITHLTLNSPVYALPHSITHLTFGNNFDQPVDELPPNLIHLTFGRSFDHAVNKLPKTVTFLKFGCMFNRCVDELPPHLTQLAFAKSFNQPLNRLPRTLQHLTTSANPNHPLNFLPPSITHLTLYAELKGPVFSLFFPTNLQQLNLSIDGNTISINLWQRKIQF